MPRGINTREAIMSDGARNQCRRNRRSIGGERPLASASRTERPRRNGAFSRRWVSQVAWWQNEGGGTRRGGRASQAPIVSNQRRGRGNRQ